MHRISRPVCTHRYVARISQKDASFDVEFSFIRSVPKLFTSGLLLLVDEPIDRSVVGVDDDLIPVLHERNRSSKPGFRHHMANDKSSGGSTEPTVSYKGSGVAQPGSGNCTGWTWTKVSVQPLYSHSGVPSISGIPGAPFGLEGRILSKIYIAECLKYHAPLIPEDQDHASLDFASLQSGEECVEAAHHHECAKLDKRPLLTCRNTLPFPASNRF